MSDSILSNTANSLQERTVNNNGQKLNSYKVKWNLNNDEGVKIKS